MLNNEEDLGWRMMMTDLIRTTEEEVGKMNSDYDQEEEDNHDEYYEETKGNSR